MVQYTFDIPNKAYLSFINAQDSLDNLIGKNVTRCGVLTDGKDMDYQNHSSTYVSAVRQLCFVRRATRI